VRDNDDRVGRDMSKLEHKQRGVCMVGMLQTKNFEAAGMIIDKRSSV